MRFESEGRAVFYDALDLIEQAVERGDEGVAELIAATRTVVREAELAH